MDTNPIPAGRIDILFMRMLDRAVSTQQNPVVSGVYQHFIRPHVDQAAREYLAPKESTTE